MRTIVYIGSSLDGFIARKDGNIDWLTTFENEGVHSRFKKFIEGIDAIVMGRGTFEKVLTFPFWPYDKDVFVLTTSIKQIPDHLKEKVTILAMRPAELLAYLKNKGYSDIYIDGGKVIQDFLKEDCIDELIITKVPVLIGSGISLFGILEKDLIFEHLRTQVFSNGLVTSHYRRKRK